MSQRNTNARAIAFAATAARVRAAWLLPTAVAAYFLVLVLISARTGAGTGFA